MVGIDKLQELAESIARIYIRSNYWLKVVGNQKVGGSEMCQSVPICLGPRRSMFFSLLILLSSLILCISVSAPVKQNE
jgi:hypothetical protein